METIELEYKKEWFQSAYYVYVLSIKHKTKGQFYYIGQTGDRNHTSARSPFYRLWGHFNPYNLKKGTDAQLIKGLVKNKLLIKEKSTRLSIDKTFAKGDVSIMAKYFKISDFNNKNHSDKRKETESIELSLIKLFQEANFKLFNDLTKIGDAKKLKAIKEIHPKAAEIFNIFNYDKKNNV